MRTFEGKTDDAVSASEAKAIAVNVRQPYGVSPPGNSKTRESRFITEAKANYKPWEAAPPQQDAFLARLAVAEKNVSPKRSDLIPRVA